MKSILKKGASCIGVAHNFAWAAFFHRKSFSFFADPPLQKNLCKKQFSSLQFSEKRRRARFQQQERIQLRDNPHSIQKNLTKQISVVDFGLGWESHHLPQFVISTLCPFVNYRQILEEGTNKSKPSSLEGKMSGINWPHHIVHSLKHVGGPTLRPWGWGFQSRLWFAWKIIHTVYWKLQMRTHERKSKLDVAHFSCCCIKRKREI